MLLILQVRRDDNALERCDLLVTCSNPSLIIVQVLSAEFEKSSDSICIFVESEDSRTNVARSLDVFRWWMVRRSGSVRLSRMDERAKNQIDGWIVIATQDVVCGYAQPLQWVQPWSLLWLTSFATLYLGRCSTSPSKPCATLQPFTSVGQRIKMFPLNAFSFETM